MNYSINKVLGVYSKGKNGADYRTAKGDTFKIAQVQFNEDPRTVKLFVWANQILDVGTQYEGEILSEEYNGKTTFSFKGDQKVDKYMERIAELEFSLNHAHTLIKNIVDHLKKEPWKVSPQYNHAPTSLPPEIKAAQAVSNEPILPTYMQPPHLDEINAADIPF